MSIILEKLFLVACILAATLASCVSCAPTTFNRTVIIDSQQDTAKLWPSVVRLVTVPTKKGGDGHYIATGWAIDKDHVMTAGHFCENATDLMKLGKAKGIIRLELINAQGRPRAQLKGIIVKYVNRDDQDMCVIRSKNHSIAPLPFVDDLSQVETEDKIFIVGAPRGKFPVKRDGYISALANNAIFVAIEIQPGNSGGPVIWRGRVVGMVVQGFIDINELGIAIPADRLMNFIKENIK